MSKKFDLAIMNPPYDDGSKGMGHIDQKIILASLKYANETIVIDMAGWVENRLAKFRDKSKESCFDYLTNLEFIDNDKFNKLFNIGASQRGVIMTLTPNETDWYDKNYDKSNPIYKILENMPHSWASASKAFIGDNIIYLKRKSFSNKDKFIYRENERKGKLNQYDYSLSFKTKVELENFISSFETTFMKFVLKEIRPGRIIRVSALPIMQDYTQPWTDERFREYFNITDEEWKEIEETMSKYK